MSDKTFDEAIEDLQKTKTVFWDNHNARMAELNKTILDKAVTEIDKVFDEESPHEKAQRMLKEIDEMLNKMKS